MDTTLARQLARSLHRANLDPIIDAVGTALHIAGTTRQIATRAQVTEDQARRALRTLRDRRKATRGADGFWRPAERRSPHVPKKAL